MITDIDRAISDPRLLGAALGDLEPWRAWRTILKAAFALKLDKPERTLFKRLAGGRRAPRRRVSELWCVAGRRSGKSRMAAAISAYLAAFDDHREKLAPGEVGHILTLSPSKSQSRTIHGYVDGFLSESAILKQQVEATGAEEIRLTGNAAIAVHTNSFRTVRGRTLLGAVFDEVAYWRDEMSASPDIETYRAILPSLASTGGLLVGISSPYRKTGLLHQKHKDHYGQDDDDVLVIQAPTTLLNPTINKKVIDRARENDPEAALAEWDAEFRSDLAALLDDAAIDRAIDPDRPIELPPKREIRYRAFVDASAGRHDAFTIGICHKEGERVLTDVVRGRQAPFSPADVAAEFANLAREYGCGEVTGDNYSGEWVVQAFEANGTRYERATTPKSGLYLEMVPLFTREAIDIPDHPRLIRELRLLERRTSRSGRDSVDHPQNGSDDYANAVAGAAWLCAQPVHSFKVSKLKGF